MYTFKFFLFCACAYIYTYNQKQPFVGKTNAYILYMYTYTYYISIYLDILCMYIYIYTHIIYIYAYILHIGMSNTRCAHSWRKQTQKKKSSKRIFGVNTYKRKKTHLKPCAQKCCVHQSSFFSTAFFRKKKEN